MTPKQYIQYIIEAISCAADNAHDRGGDLSNYDHEHAIGAITMEIMYGEGDALIDCGYFDGALFSLELALEEDQDQSLEEDRMTRAELRPHLLEAVALFLNTVTDYGVLKEGAS